MKRIDILILLALLGACACVIPVAQPSTAAFERTIKPAVQLSAARARHPVALTVALSPRIPEQVILVRGEGQVQVRVANFRAAIAETLVTAFAPNFTQVLTASEESKQGLELVVLQVTPGKDVDVLSFHVVLTRDGKDIYEAKGEVRPESVARNISVSSWKDTLATMTAEMLELNVAQLGSDLNAQLLISDDERLRTFWRSIDDRSSGGGEAGEAPAPSGVITL